jgi:CRP-like cAMP-binding protein
MVDMLFMLGMIAYAIYRLNAVGVNLAGIVTTSAIVTGALAFSAGETLGNLWAGLSLQIENTLRIGDWVRVGDKVGQVVSIRWRSMAIATPGNETIVVPNSMLMKDRIVVLGRAGEADALYRRIVPFSVDYDYAPARVIAVITEALRRAEIPNVARTPAPYCVCREFGESGVVYAAVYFPLDVGGLMDTDSDVMVSVYAALQRHNMPIPFPQRVVEIKRPSRLREAQAAEHKARVEVLEQLELFSVLVDAERHMVADELKRLLYAGHDVVFRKGESADSLYILARGRVRIVEQDAAGHRMELAELTAPAYFGEMGLLTGQPRGATVMAEDDVVCYQLGKAGFDEILKARPQIAEALAHVLSLRQAENDAKLKALDEEARAKHALGGAREIVRRIRRFFGLPGA